MRVKLIRHEVRKFAYLSNCFILFLCKVQAFHPCRVTGTRRGPQSDVDMLQWPGSPDNRKQATYGRMVKMIRSSSLDLLQHRAFDTTHASRVLGRPAFCWYWLRCVPSQSVHIVECNCLFQPEDKPLNLLQSRLRTT